MKNIKRRSVSSISVWLILLTVFLLPIQVMAQSVTIGSSEESKFSNVASTDEEGISEGNIIGEDTTLRDEYTKYFVTDTGCTIVAQYAVPVHYKDGNGAYVNYDNSLISSKAVVSEATNDEATKDEVSSYSLRVTDEIADTFTNNKSDSKVSHFKESGKAKLIEINRDGHKISWGYSGANTVIAKEQKKENAEEFTGNDAYLNLTNLSSTVLYENIYNNIDLEVINSTTGVKENLILKASNVKNVFKIEYNIGDLTAESVDEQTIELKDAADKVVYIISAPYMKDAKGEISEALELKILSNNKGKLSVKLTADKTWLKDKSRAYPVTVDPSFQYEQDWGVVESTFINENAKSESYGAGGTNYQGSIYVGRPEADSKLRRSLIKIVDPETSIPLKNGDMIVNAQIALAQVTDDLTETIYVGAYEATSSWTQSTATWSNAPSCSSVLIDYEKIPAGTQEWRFWDVTELVKKWYNGETNNGFYLKAINESDVGQGLQFTSSSNPEDKDYRPCFVLTYRNNKGLEGYWSYTTIDCGRAGTAYINDYSGNLVFDMPLAATASPTMAAGLGYTYNSYYAGQKYTDSYPYTGRGWKMNIQQTLYETSEDLLGKFQKDYPYVYTDADGTEHYFCPKVENGTTKYYDEDGLNLELQITKTSKTDYYVIVNEDNEKFHFNQSGLLSKMENKSGKSVVINYSGNKITSIADAEGDTITFTVNDTTNNYVKKITDSDGKVTTVTFTGSKIGGITYNDGQSVSFTYDDAGKLLSVTDVDGSKVKFTYSSHGSKGVTSVCEYGTEGTQGQKITFDRTKYNTTKIQTSGTDGVFNNSNDIITICQFDNFGKMTSTNSKTYGGVYLSASGASYTSSTVASGASNIKSINKVTQAYTVGANKENLLKNHSLEGTSNWTSAAWGSGTVDFDVTENSTNSNVLYGQKSVKMKVNSVTNDARGRIYQNVDEAYLEPGEIYTLSCYVKVTDMTPIAEDDVYGAVIGLTTFFDDGTSKNYYSEHISKVTDTSVNEGFRRLSVTISMPNDADFDYVKANLAIHSATGTAYFDGVQLEKANSAGHYNLLENASFERLSSTTQPSNWTGINLTDSTSYDCLSSANVEGDRSYRITGSTTQWKNLYQNVYLNSDAKEEDTYILSGWATGDSVPIGSNSARFRLFARVYYTDGTHKDKSDISFNDTLANVNWQYASGAFNLSDENDATTKTPSYIKVYLVYNYQGNRAYFDNLMLTKEAVPSYTYDNEGNLVSVVDNAEQNSSYEYDDNQLSEMVDPAGNNYKYDYDSNKRIKTATTSTGLKYTYTYDGNGNANSVVANGGTGLNIKSEVNYSYPGKGADTYTVAADDQNNYTSTNTYNAKNGTLISAKDVNGNITEYTYNADNDFVIDIVSGSQSVSYDYSDDYKNIESITHGDTTYSFTYDEYGNKSTVKAGDHTLATYNYLSNNGNLQTVYYGNGDNTRYVYDHFGNVSLLVKDNKNVAKNYPNSRGDIVRSVDLVNDLETRLNYDTTGRLISKDVYSTNLNTNADTWRRGFEYDYDLNNNLTRLSFIDSKGTRNTTQYRYGADNLPSTMMLSNGESLMYKYDGLNRLTEKTLYTDDNIVSVYTYATSARGNNYTTSAIKTEETDAFAYKYDYDRNGNIKAIYKGVMTGYVYSYSSTPTIEYVYDEYNQLTTVKDYSKNERYSYAYDSDGNIISFNRYSMNSGYSLESHSYTYNDSNGWGDLLTSYDGETITYDTIGNPLTYRDGMSITWVNGRELSSLSKDGKTFNFTYDPSGLRTKKSITTSSGSTTNVEYIYEGGMLIQMTYGNYVLDFSYDANGTPVAFHVDNGGTVDKYYYYGVNSRGDVEALYNADGTLHARYEYDSYGKILSVKASDGTNITATYAIAILNPLRYRSYVYDNETGFYYLQSRYYDPTICRFVSADEFASTGQGLSGHNMFSYCGNNPIVRADDEGEFWHIVAGAAIGWGVSFFSTLITTGSVEDALISGAFGMVSGAVTAACPAAGVWVDMGLAAVESVVLDCKNADEDTTVEEIVTNAAISVGFAALPGDDFFGTKAFSNEVSQLTNVVSTMSKNADAPIKSAVGNYTKKWGKEAMFACEDSITSAAAQTVTQEFTKVCVRLMVKEGLI